MVLITKEARELALKEQLNNIEHAINKLQEYQDSTLSDLPEDLLKLIKSITVLPKFSSTGLEKVSSILDNLYICRFIAKKVLAGEPLPGEEPPVEGQKNIVIEELKNKETKEPMNQNAIPTPRPRQKTQEQINQNINPAPRPRPKAPEQSITGTPVEKQSSLRGNAQEQKNPTRTPIKKQNQPLINLQDISHIKPPESKQTTRTVSSEMRAVNQSAVPNIPTKKTDPLDPFE
ncbi:MAG: hypothetical protein ACD_58C00132G0011 [uncultured bacterium]|nr:MAG: hypothetical protein ACD_58C00132G0011 [uncultured bacterium]